jgi:hypothetical protein
MRIDPNREWPVDDQRSQERRRTLTEEIEVAGNQLIERIKQLHGGG